MISAAIVSFNEAEKLEVCLKSIKDFAGEIIVVDLGSKDNTKKVCKRFGAKIFYHKRVSFVEEVRDFSISKTSNDWILVLDPDEQITDSLKIKLKEILEYEKYVAVNIPRKNIFFGRWIAYTNWWPDRHVRFFRRGKVKWGENIHSYPNVEGRILDLPAEDNLAIIHYGYDRISEFIERQDRYANVVSEQMYKRGMRFSWVRLILWPGREFVVRYIKHKGFLDGIYGFILTFLMMIYQVMILVKLWEKEKIQ